MKHELIPRNKIVSKKKASKKLARKKMASTKIICAKIASKNTYPRSLQKQQGVVLVIALFFVALAVSMAYAMMSRLERDTRRTSLLLRATQADFYAQASIDWAKDQLRNNLTNKKPNLPIDVMPLESATNNVNGYSIVSKITDMQARMNINNLKTPEAQKDFKHLMQLVDPNLNEQRAQAITLAVADWITPGQQQNEYNKYYMSLSPPYRAAHRPMASVSELRLVKDMTPALFNALQSYLAALPEQTAVSVQTASAYVLAALNPTMTLEAGKTLEKIILQSKPPTIEAFLNIDFVKNHNLPKDKVSMESNYFLVETVVTIEKQQIVIYTLIERGGNQSKPSVNVLWQSKSVPG
jgi:general secretion pathway protein K